MKCSRWEKSIALYIESDLPERKVRLVEKHLLTCPACLDFSETLKESQRHVRSLHNESLNETVYEEMRNRVMNEIASGSLIHHRGTIAGILGKWHWKPLIAGALLMLLIALASWYRHSPDEASPPVSSLKVEGISAPVTPEEEVSHGMERRPVDVQVVQKLVPLEGKRTKARKPTLSVPVTQTSPQPYQIVQSHPSNPEQDRKEISSPLPEPLYIELATGDPDVLIVWLIEPKRGERK